MLNKIIFVMQGGKNFLPMNSNRQHCNYLERSSLKYVHWIQLHKHLPPHKPLTLSTFIVLFASMPDLDSFQLLHFVRLIALCLGGFVQKQNLTSFVLRMNKQENEAPWGGSDSITILGTDARQVQVPFMTKDFTDCRLSFEKHVSDLWKTAAFQRISIMPF